MITMELTDQDIEQLLDTGDTLCFATVLDHEFVICPRIGRTLQREVKFEWKRARASGLAERWRLEVPDLGYEVVEVNPLKQHVGAGDTVILRARFPGL